MGKRFVGVALDLDSGERVKVPIGEDRFAGERAEELSGSIRTSWSSSRVGLVHAAALGTRA
jgi:hypothetical protein